MDESEESFIKNRRKSKRIDGIVVEYYRDGQEPTLKKAFVKDISITGICIYAQETIEKDTVLCLIVYLFNEKEPITAKGKVVWQSSETGLAACYVGIEFTEMDKVSSKVLSEHIPSE